MENVGHFDVAAQMRPAAGSFPERAIKTSNDFQVRASSRPVIHQYLML